MQVCFCVHTVHACMMQCGDIESYVHQQQCSPEVILLLDVARLHLTG